VAPRPDDEAPARGLAALAALLVLLGGARLLGQAPVRGLAGRAEARIQLQLVAAPAAQAPAPGQAGPPEAGGRPGLAATAGPAPGGAGSAPAPPAAGPGPATSDLFDAAGRPRLPPGAVPQPPAAFHAPDPLQRPNPVDYRGTRFEQDWASDGDLGEVARRGIARAQKKVAELVFGRDIEHARARPPPQVRFNPARHERPADLGSEASGDAWKAAPISYEPAPGLDGEASRRIRAEVAALEREHGACAPARLQALAGPILEQLEALQRAEYAHARGADPVRAAHQLPAAANAAWDQARRALWHARRQLADCRGQGLTRQPWPG